MKSETFPSEVELSGCLLQDRPILRKRMRDLAAKWKAGQLQPQVLQKLWQVIFLSQEILQRRHELLPVLEYPGELPISERREKIAEHIKRHQVVILCGETGSGKSTQLPKICLELGRGVVGRIGHTQPRRIAARTLASRISEELRRELGSVVGFKVRFQDRLRPETQVKLMTDGILLAEIQGDRLLLEYDTLIIDEAHERSLNIDFLLGYLKQLLPRRRDLKLIITSATINPQRFAEHFDGAPVLEVSGRTYPVSVLYRPPEVADISERDESMQRAIVSAVDELSLRDRGHILVFLSGEREIRDTAETLRKHKLQLTEVLPLYSRQGSGDQARVFQPSSLRRIILATNVAETSLTVPGVRYVIDPGFARISRYSQRSKIQRLPVEPISQASANQRAGRCGRMSAGICIRLYAEDDFLTRREFTEPEILRTNLAAVILQMLVLGFGDIDAFPFLDPPDSRLIRDGYRTLEELGAVEIRTRQVTRLGRELARLPVDPRIGRMVWEAANGGCLREVLVIAGALSVQDPRDRPLEKQQEADAAHSLFKHRESDFLAYWQLWNFLEEQRHHLSKTKFRQLCKEWFLSWSRVQEWYDTLGQLREQLASLGWHENTEPGGYESIHRALLSGLLGNVGVRDSEREFLGCWGTRFLVFPGSGLFEKPPKWVMAAELVETTRLYARTLARIEPEWVEAAAGHIVQRCYADPFWDGAKAYVGAYEKVTFYGLTLIQRRRVHYGPINPIEAREIFIRFALVEGDFRTRAPFFRHNQELVDYVRYLEQKVRRRQLLVDQEVRFQFYDQRIPAGIVGGPSFEQWLRRAGAPNRKRLHMQLSDLLLQSPEGNLDELYPDRLDLAGLDLPLEYHFEPGHPADGLTLVVPCELVNQISEGRCDWLVPGLIGEKLIALMRSLPKHLRKAIMPIPEMAEACLRELRPGEQPLVRLLGAEIKRRVGVHVPEDAWKVSSLPDYLQMRYRLINEQGRTLAAGRDLQELRRQYGNTARTKLAQYTETFMERTGFTTWTFGILPETQKIERGGVMLRGYPAIVDEGASVSIRILDSKAAAITTTRDGLRRLFQLDLGRDLRSLRRQLPGLRTMILEYAPAPEAPEGLVESPQKDLDEELMALILDVTFLEGQSEIRDEESFRRRLEEARPSLGQNIDAVCRLAAEILGDYRGLRERLSTKQQINWKPSLDDIRQQLDRLIFRGFFLATPWAWLRQMPRYLKAISVRLDRLEQAAWRDQSLLSNLQTWLQAWRERDAQMRALRRRDERLEEIRWMLEELRVSFFAQELKTVYPISLQRLERRWKELGL